MMNQLEKMNLIDNFLFSTMIDHEKYGPAAAQTILETILQWEVKTDEVFSEPANLCGCSVRFKGAKRNAGDRIRLAGGGFRRLFGTFPRGEGFWFPLNSPLFGNLTFTLGIAILS